MKDRTRIVSLAVVTVPLAWFALAGGGGASSSEPPPLPAPEASEPGLPDPPTPVEAPSSEASGPSAPAVPAPVDPVDPVVVERGTGDLTVVPGGTAASGPGPVKRYTVAVEGGLGIDPVDFAAQVDRTLADSRSWGSGGRWAFQRVDVGPVDLEVVLASPTTTDRLCRPLSTNGVYSCAVGKRAALNSMRWLRGADAYAGRLPEYRQYVVNHEVGHTLGHGHAGCGGAGEPAPVMMQQTKGVGACLPWPWPSP